MPSIWSTLPQSDQELIDNASPEQMRDALQQLAMLFDDFEAIGKQKLYSLANSGKEQAVERGLAQGQKDAVRSLRGIMRLCLGEEEKDGSNSR